MKLFRTVLILIYGLLYLNTSAQSQVDTVRYPLIPNVSLPDVEVVGYIQPQLRLLTPTSVGVLNKGEIEMQSVTSMVPVMNTVPGVRMEERSPGSYRLSIRGSLVRSPYGVRNVKVYYNDFPLTDAGGNTYLNSLSINDLSGIEILKGPDGSLFGANSGGVVLLKSNIDGMRMTEGGIYGGSFGLVGNTVSLARNSGNHYWSIRQSYQRADGYRRNSRHHRLFVQISDKWQYRPGNSLEGYAFYSDLAYRTPGALTEEQYNEDPKQARQPTATMPGSEEQKTRITTRMYFVGLRHRMNILPYLTHTISVSYNHVDFIYPFITNYEIRHEDNLALRTYFTLAPVKSRDTKWHPSLDVGFEGQRLVTDAYNYDNHAGVKGDIQAYNDILNTQYFGFLRGRLEWNNKLVIEAAISLNHNGYHFRDTTQIKDNFPAVWMPHFAVNYRVIDPLTLRFIFSKGYSTPTTAEVRPSDNTVHKDLYAEQGWNTEVGARLHTMNGRLSLDASAFHYLLEDGIISQVDSTGNTFFINSGKIRQYGIEASGYWQILPYSPGNAFFKKIQWNSSYTWSYFHYDQYSSGTEDYSGNRVAGVPRSVFVNSLHFDFPANVYLFVQHNHTSRIALNDANSAFADSYNLLSARIGINGFRNKALPAKIYVAADNILNEKYSLGNDLNAFGKRYYNAAPTFNFMVGATWKL